MRLNHDCVRDILLCIEDCTGDLNAIYRISYICDSLSSKYSSNEIEYHMHLLDEAGFIYGIKFFVSGDGILQRLSWKGHEYLDNIRDKSAWSKLKDGSIDLSCMSLDVLGQIAKELALSIAKKKLGLE